MLGIKLIRCQRGHGSCGERTLLDIGEIRSLQEIALVSDLLVIYVTRSEHPLSLQVNAGEHEWVIAVEPHGVFTALSELETRISEWGLRLHGGTVALH